MRKLVLFWIAILFAAGGTAWAQQQQPSGPLGQTSGPAAGRNVIPSTVAQKLFEGRSVAFEEDQLEALDASAISAGTPGVPGRPGTQSGGSPLGREPSKPVY